MLKLEYLESPGRYSQGNDAFLGKWRVGWVGWDSMLSRDDPNKYKATCNLSGIREVLGYFETEEEAKARLLKAVEAWVSGAGLMAKE